MGPPYSVTATVALVTKWYELLQDMKYLGPEAIAYPPHTGEQTVNVTLARYLGLDEQVVQTMQLMPYVRKDAGGGWVQPKHDILWQDGHFVDFRLDTDIWLSRDPLRRINTQQDPIDSEIHHDTVLESTSMPSYAIPLSIIRPRQYVKYGLVIVLDTVSNSIVVLDTQSAGWGNSDPFFEQFGWGKIPRKYRIPGSFYGSTSDLYARKAPAFLRDMISKAIHLDAGFVPGSIRSDKQYTPELSPPQWETWIRDLYRQAGWNSTAVNKLFFPDTNITKVENGLEDFSSYSLFLEEMQETQHNISVKYLSDRYCPVPRVEKVYEDLMTLGKLTDEQYAYAKSDEPVIPLDLEGWGGKLAFMQPPRDDDD